MKKTIISILFLSLFSIVYSQSIYNPAQIGQTGRNQCTSRGFWVKSDTSLFTSLVWIPLGASSNYVLTSDANGFATWQPAAGGSGWSLTGNSGTIPGTNYVGTTDNNLIFKIYNVTAGMLDSTLLNTSYGQRALYSASGALNTALGYISLANNTSGTRNTAIGANSFATATTGSRNTGIGYASANQLTTGSGNVVIGNQTARFLTTGNRNVVIGDSAQVGTTTTNSIVIGANANGNLGDSTLVITNAIAHMHLLLNGGSNGDVLTTDGSGDATWQPTTNTAWGLSGNAGTNPATNLIGVTDSSDFYIGSTNELPPNYGIYLQPTQRNIFLNAGDNNGNGTVFTAVKDGYSSWNFANNNGSNTGYIDLYPDSVDIKFSSGGWLNVYGQLKIVDGTQANGYVLTSDANGGASWQPTTNTAWGLSGNSGTNPATNFIGTTDSVGLRIENTSAEIGLGKQAISLYAHGINDALGLVLQGESENEEGLVIDGYSASQTAVRINGYTDDSYWADIEINAATGKLKITGIGEANGYVLTSDANGGASWQPTTNTAWGLSGNAGTDPATSLLGTSDTSRLAIGVDSKKLLFLDANKNLFTDTLLSATIKAYDYNGDCDGGYSIFTLEDKDECGGANLKHVTSTNTTIIRATTHAYLSCDDGINSSFLDLQETKTTCNTDSFEVIGKIKIVDGTEGNGKVLTSNANGLASWTPTSTTELDSATIYALTPSNGTQYYCTDCTGNGITGRIVAFIGAAWRRLLFED